jgi:hypothetical protein
MIKYKLKFYVSKMHKIAIKDNIYITQQTILLLSTLINSSKEYNLMIYNSEDYPEYTRISFSIPGKTPWILFYFKKEMYEI